MKPIKIMVVAFATLCAFIANAQNFIPVIDFTGNKVFGSIVRTMENPTDSPIQCCFADLPQTDSQFMARYIVDSITNPSDTEQAKMEISHACVRYLKDPANMVNGALIFETPWGDSLLYKKEHSLIGRMYSTYTSQCGNNAKHARAIQVYRTPYFKQDDIHDVYVPRHAFTETRFKGYYSMTDYDVGTAFYMFPDSTSPNGYASVMDVRADTSLIRDKYLQDGQDLHQFSSVSEYRQVVAESPIYISQSQEGDPIRLTGEFIIPAHSKITTTTAGPIFFLDSTNTANMQLLAHTTALVEQTQNSGGCLPCVLDSVIQMIETFWPEADSSTLDLLLGGSSFVIYNSVLDQGRPFPEIVGRAYSRDSIPAWYFETNSPDTLHIGRGKDVKMPLLVMEAGNCLIGDTMITSPAIFPIWSSTHTPNILTYKEVNYLESGYILPGPHTIKLSVNANLISNFKAWNLIGGDDLIIRTFHFPYKGDTTTVGVRELPVIQDEFTWQWVGDKTVQVSHDCQLVDMLGRVVVPLSAGKTSLDFLSRGIYILSPFREKICIR